MDSPAVTAREILLEIARNMREGLEPLRYSTLAPSIYRVYLHPDDLERLRGILPRIVEEGRRALDEELETLNRGSLAERIRMAHRAAPKITAPDTGWQIQILENTDDDVEPGDLTIHSELALPARTEYADGSMTKRIATRRIGGAASVSQQYEPAPGGAVHAIIEYQDNGGRHIYKMSKDQIVVGRGGRDYWTDLKLDSAPDVSREHFRLRRDLETGKFYLKDLSRLGTTINGEAVPSSVEFIDGDRRDKNVEAPVPNTARIGLAGVIFLDFRSTSNA